MDAVTDKKIKRAFALIDEDNDGFLNQEQHALFLQVLGHNITPSEVANLPAKADLDRALVEHKSSMDNCTTAEDFKNTMELWDQDKTGHVEFKNLAAALKSFAGASEEDVVRMRKELKVEGDDFAYGGFVDVMRGVEFVDPKAVK
eukprot:TRINITY_DN4242_c0_g1_i6.p1 TRINITY_DN4242_c0_g1~~TRINITY_DN4242_c0_g1_i6.p1  ORF type:complete len:145 (+),score=45.59 TRINITY_DN4242_c0_g1_i6:217-651(+)